MIVNRKKKSESNFPINPSMFIGLIDPCKEPIKTISGRTIALSLLRFFAYRPVKDQKMCKINREIRDPAGPLTFGHPRPYARQMPREGCGQSNPSSCNIRFTSLFFLSLTAPMALSAFLFLLRTSGANTRNQRFTSYKGCRYLRPCRWG